MKSNAFNKPVYRKLDGIYTAKAGPDREWVGYFKSCTGTVVINDRHFAGWLEAWPDTGGANVNLDDGRAVFVPESEIPDDQREKKD